jgi:thiol:disulfide interchange protein DsbG
MNKLSKWMGVALMGVSVSAFAAAPKAEAAKAVTPTASAAAPAPINLTTPAAKLVTQVIGDQGTIIDSFTAVGGLTGFVIQASQGSNNNGIVYADKKGQYLFVGSIINAKGQDMTQLYTNQYINSKIAGPAYSAAMGLSYFTSGKDSAPHKALVIMDPNCSYCHLVYKEFKPLIDSGQVQVRWLPVAFRDPTSPGKAAALLNAGSGAAALLDQNEKNFDDQSEEGAITPLQPNPNDPAMTKIFAEVAQNTEFFSKFGFQGTPTILYKKADGSVVMVPGYLQGQAFQAMIDNMGPNW